MVVFHHFPINKEGQWDSPIVYIYISVVLDNTLTKW